MYSEDNCTNVHCGHSIDQGRHYTIRPSIQLLVFGYNQSPTNVYTLEDYAHSNRIKKEFDVSPVFCMLLNLIDS